MPRKAGSTTAPANESKEDKFIRLGVARLNKTVKSIRSMSKLVGSGYESTDEQRQGMLRILSDELRKLQATFSGEVKAKVAEFTAADLIRE